MSQYTEEEISDWHKLSNHWAMWGPGSLVRRIRNSWHLSELVKHQGVYKTKREAVEAVDKCVLERSRRMADDRRAREIASLASVEQDPISAGS